MSSTFMGLNIGASALSTYQAAVNTTANNIANVRTTGYTRQQTEINATAALRVNAKYGSVGTGVEASAITQIRNEYYDVKYWQNNSSYGLYEQKLYYLDQIQGILADDNNQTGFSTIFSSMFNSLDSLISDGPGDVSTRNQFVNKAQSLCTYFNALYTSLQDIQSDCNEEIKTTVDSINSMSDKLALLNKEIYNLEVRGGKANELRDQRNNIIDELSKVVNVEAQEVEVVNSNGENLGATTYRVFINGQELIDGFQGRHLEITSSDYKNNQCDIDGLYSIVWEDTKMDFAATTINAGGSLKALFEVRDGNNAEALQGKVKSASSEKNTLTLTNLNVKDLTSLNAAEKGTLLIDGKYYYYSSFEMQIDKEGNLGDITFHLTPGENAAAMVDALNITKPQALCGKDVDALGVPYYMAQINNFLRTFTKMFNDMEREGMTLDGEQMGTFFTAETITGIEHTFDEAKENSQYNIENVKGYDDKTMLATFQCTDSTYFTVTAQSIQVNSMSLRDARYFATTKDIVNGIDAYDIVTSLKTLQKGVTVFRGDTAEKFLETLVSDAAVDVNKNETFCNNYSNLTSAMDKLRTSESGVDEDEEAMDLIKFQNAYNLASKLISVMQQLYDKLINETAV